MVYFSVDWSLSYWLQSIDRNYRVGQDKKVTVYRLVARGTTDGYRIKALDAKKDIGAMLTSKLSCAVCPQQMECLEKNIELFDPLCIHQRSIRRTVAHAEVIE